MDKKLLITTFFFVAIPAAQAEVFKCVEAGKTVFSDQPCAENAEKLELNIYQPKSEDIKKQQQTTQQYQRDSQHNLSSLYVAKMRAWKSRLFSYKKNMIRS